MRKNPQVIEQELDDEIMVIPIVDGIAQMKRVCCLSGSGVFIWSILSNNIKIETVEIINKVAVHYQLPKEDVKEDILEFIQIMKNHGLVLCEEE